MGTTSQKLNRVLETKSDLKTVINYSGANITNETTFKEYPKLLNKAYIDILNDEGESLYNALPKTTGTGTSVNLDVEKGKMKIELNSTQIEQVSTSGNNLIKFPNITQTTVNGITYSIQDDVISLNGTATDNVRYIYASNFAFDGAGDYRITLIPISGNYTSGVIGISSRTEDKTTQIVWQQVASGAMTNKKTYTAENISQIKNIGIYINNGSVINNLKFKFMFTKGDTIPTTYENMKSPTPDYPQDIHVITGSNNIKIQNKNLLYSNLEYPFTTKGVTVTQEDDGSITLNGTQSGGAMHIIFNNAFFDIIKKYEGTEISISLTTSGQGSFSNFGIKNGTSVDLLIATSPSLSKTQTLNLNNYSNIYFDIWFNNTSRTFVDYNIKPQVEVGERTNYVEHQEQNYPIDLKSDNLFNKNVGFTNDYIDNSGNLITTGNNALMKGYIKVKPNTTYMISQDISIYSIGICLYNETTFIGRIPQILDTDHRTFTTNENTNQIRLFINLDNQTPMTQTIIDNLNIQLNEGNVIKPYTPYIANPIEYCKLGNYADQIFKNTTDSEFYDSTLELNEWYFKKNIDKVVLNGSENWRERTNAGAVKQFYVSSGSQRLIGYKQFCNYFSNYNASLYNYGSVGNFAIFTNTGEFFGCVSNDITLEGFKSKLAIENLIVYYVLSTPQYIHISETDYSILRNQLENIYNNSKSYNGQTIITQTNDDLPFNLELSALAKIE